MLKNFKMLKAVLALILAFALFMPCCAYAEGEFTVKRMPPGKIVETSNGGLLPERVKLNYPKFMSVQAVIPPAYTSLEYVSSVKNQGQNNTCWTFATTNAVESNMIRNGGSEVDLSEIHIVYSSIKNSDGSNGNVAQGFDIAYNEGGNRYMSSAYLMRDGTLGGLISEAQDPYPSSLMSPSRSLATTKSKLKSHRVRNVYFLDDEGKSTVPNKLKEAIMDYGAVPCAMYFEPNNTILNAQYYSAANAAYYYNLAFNGGNHAVTLVGWDDSFDRLKFNSARRPANNGAWLVKNSYGTSWGDGGYFWISYEDTNFPISPWAVDGVDEFDIHLKTYEHDPHGFIGYFPVPSVSAFYGANVFEVTSNNEVVKQVKLFSINPGTTVNIYIIKNYTGTGSLNINSADATLLNQGVLWNGWYTFDVPDVSLGAAGSKFAVIVKYIPMSGNPVLLPAEFNEPGFGGCIADIKAGNSFYSSSGTGSWVDLYGNPTDPAALNIKAVTETPRKRLDLELISENTLSNSSQIVVRNKFINSVGGALISAIYDGGQLVETKLISRPFTGSTDNTETVSFTNSTTSRDVKHFLWSDLESIKPLMSAE